MDPGQKSYLNLVNYLKCVFFVSDPVEAGRPEPLHLAQRAGDTQAEAQPVPHHRRREGQDSPIFFTLVSSRVRKQSPLFHISFNFQALLRIRIHLRLRIKPKIRIRILIRIQIFLYPAQNFK